MERLAEFDPAKSVKGSPGTVWLDDAYAQAHGNKPEYAGRVHGVSNNICPCEATFICITYRPK
jgi:hypothetical protein